MLKVGSSDLWVGSEIGSRSCWGIGCLVGCCMVVDYPFGLNDSRRRGEDCCPSSVDRSCLRHSHLRPCHAPENNDRLAGIDFVGYRNFESKTSGKASENDCHTLPSFGHLVVPCMVDFHRNKVAVETGTPFRFHMEDLIVRQNSNCFAFAERH